jgi:hypothetical protein
MNKGIKKLIPLIAGLFILFAGVAFYVAFQSARQLESVVVAKGNIAAYTLVSPSDISAVGVPKGSVTANDITWATYEKNYVKANKPLITTLQVLAGDRLDSREVAVDSQSSFDVVSADERVVAVTATIVGAGLGTINAGDVVDAQESSNGGTGGGGTTFAKVICISASAAGCAGVLPPGVTLSVTGSSSSTTTSSSLVYVLLSVDANDAAAIAGQQVSLDLNPFCTFGSTASNVTPSQFVSARPNGPKCQAPPGRDATTGGTGAVPTSG